jgi:branched-subunit amino acid transport protein AzlD
VLRIRLIIVLLVAIAGVVAFKFLPLPFIAGNHPSDPAVRLFAAVWSSIMAMLLVYSFAVERPRGAPITWAEALAGSVAVFGITILVYGSVPHEWLTYADSVLKWREDKMFLRHGQQILGIDWPLDITGRAVRDTVATLIYVVYFGLHLAGWVAWQKRGERRPLRAVPATAPAGTSAYGRPVVKQG